VPRYTNEIELRNLLGIESWRNLSKDTVLRLLESLPDVDPEVALKLIAQVPEITQLAKAALDDVAKAYDAALESNARSQEMVHEIHRETLEILSAELDKDLTPEERMRVFDEIRDLNLNARLKDTENKGFIAAQFDKKLAVAGGAFVTVIAVVFAAARSGAKATP
jgi:hypothetical protein